MKKPYLFSAGYPFSMFVTKRRCFDFVPVFCLKCRKLVYESFSVNESSSAKSKKEYVALTSDYICLQKMKKGTLFYQLVLVATRWKRVPFFYQFCCHSKRLARVYKFQDIPLIKATFTNKIANGVNSSYPFC